MVSLWVFKIKDKIGFYNKDQIYQYINNQNKIEYSHLEGNNYLRKVWVDEIKYISIFLLIIDTIC